MEKSTVKVRDWMNYDQSDSTMEPENKLPSMTVPDMTLSVQQIYERAQMGLPPEGERVPIYDEGMPFPDISRMDLVDRQLFIKHYQDEINNLLTPKEATQKASDQLKNDKEERKVAEAALDDLLVKD